MPNLPDLPSAQDIALGDARRGDYGERLTFSINDVGELDLSDGDVVLVTVRGDDQPEIDLTNITSQTVPYVNLFVRDHGVKVEKYWRTKLYRVSVGKAKIVTQPAPQQSFAFTAPPATSEGVFIPTPEAMDEIALRQVPAAFTSAFEDDASIPGVERPTHIKVKSAGKGWSDLGGIVIPNYDVQTLVDAWKLRQSGVPASVLVTGPAGTAKTALVRAFAASQDVDFLKVDGGAIRTADDWAGAFRQDPNTKTWQHRWSPFARVLQRARPTIVLVDELNRTESPGALNALLGLFDWTGSLLVPDANAVLHMPPGVLVVATANIGPEFVGTLPLDGAVRQRFPFGIRLDYPTPEIEEKLLVNMAGIEAEEAERLVRIAGMQRANREDPQQYPSGAVISTRVLIDISRRIASCDTEARDAVTSTLKAQFDPGDEPALSVLVDSQYPIFVEVEDDAVVEVSDEAIAAEVAEDTDSTYTCQGTSRYGGVCGRDVYKTSRQCPACSEPNPIVTQLAAAAAAAPKPLITVAKHYFVNRGLDGSLTAECQYRFDPKDTKVCGKSKDNAIHH